MKLKFDRVQIEGIIDNVVQKTKGMDFGWDWAGGVAFYGIARAYEVTKNEEYLEYLSSWVDYYIDLGIPPMTVNAVSIGHAIITLYEVKGDEKYLNILRDMADYLKNDAIRFGKGIFQHTVSQNYYFPEQAWDDTLFMAGYFLIRVGVLLKDDEYYKDGINQFVWHIELLQNKSTNLFYHAWDNIGQNNLSAVYWCRGNSWVTLTMALTLKTMPLPKPELANLDYGKIMYALRDQLSTIARIQKEDGLWGTVLDHMDSYSEVSGSCAIANGFLVFNESIYTKNVQAALNGILENIEPDGSVRNVSAGTGVMKDANEYKIIIKDRIQGWGQGLALAFLADVLEAENEN